MDNLIKLGCLYRDGICYYFNPETQTLYSTYIRSVHYNKEHLSTIKGFEKRINFKTIGLDMDKYHQALEEAEKIREERKKKAQKEYEQKITHDMENGPTVGIDSCCKSCQKKVIDFVEVIGDCRSKSYCKYCSENCVKTRKNESMTNIKRKFFENFTCECGNCTVSW